MATSLPPVTVPEGTWTDLYAETGITAGNQLIIQNTGSGDVRLVESATEPNLSSGFNFLIPTLYVTNSSANVGAWAFSDLGTQLQVEEV